MLKLATVFSGIGAIEHALKRMGIEHEIVFASDNGDVDIFKKKININFVDIINELNRLKKIINNIDLEIDSDYEYLNDLESHLCRINERITIIKDENKNCKFDIFPIIDKVDNEKIKNDIKTILNNYNNKNDIENIDKILIISKIEKENPNLIHEIISENSINIKSVIKELKEIVVQLGMLDEKIETLNIHSELRKIKNYSDKKKYVDNLYKGKEKSNFVKQSYFANYNIDEANFHWNVSFIDGYQYRNKVDLFVGGSPCQSFSMVGKQRGLGDTRGTLFYEYARLVKEIQPKVFIYENVKAVLNNDNGKTWSTMSKVFDELGYKWKLMVLNSRDFGVAQNRERIFVVGFRNDIKLKREFEEPKKRVLNKTMKDYLLDNVSGKYYLNKKGVAFVTDKKNLKKKWTQIDGEIQLCQKKNQQFNWHGDFVFEEENKDKEKTIQDLEKYFLSEKVKKYVLASGTKNFYSKPEIDLDIARPLLTTMHKMHRAGVDNYVTTEGRLRKLTPRECLRLMGFCDSFKIVVSDTQAYQQAGNSIVVDVLIEIMSEIINVYPKIIE
ncbi:DNA (cytosine-5-)-methyltransferase [Clostridium perfringens]|nr:DNA (cytosine-5-)-methyltransferase [Clostridium perfringens]EJT5914651.1 DNA (cytosine-5-)-methyltransferase [Clostridium perfringens]ELC8408239.1 DNA (cytosine-5-)-methyltransferase [Clostridium perfringens]MDK0808053.1 DNA (cytosine-5-)-methyltransferase [Clostridium perfringens]MDM1003747.1 DNA (cytosine-5-)-methyltransferase [Clostridium perfringens]SQB39281.1 DNA-cytosine methyltransferase [Clostridium perfringens]